MKCRLYPSKLKESEVGPVNDGELVVIGVGVIEGPSGLRSFSGDRDQFYDWAENYEKVLAYEVLISSEEVDIESLNNQDE